MAGGAEHGARTGQGAPGGPGASDERPLETGWLADTPIDDTLFRQFLHNQGEVNAIFAEALDGRVDDTPDVFLADAGSPVPYMNQAILTRPLTGADDDVLDRAESFFASSRWTVTLLSIWPTPDLRGRGWLLVGHPAFVARGPAPVDQVERAGVEVRRASNADDIATAERVAIEGYPIEEAVGQPPGSVFPPGLIGRDVIVRLGLVDGEPVAIGNAHVGHGVVNLCLGATLPAARRRGVWQSLVWARVADAPDRPAVAYTSDYSRPGFIRMGFMPITRFTMWARGGG
jgi:hypothetical protein